ncbi:neprilysin-11-like [Periplaneta americana]|uniref:neprilysin-11-like n=1 Tax=Periplaneta americana TaxID=6978 RepID=UPI0037E79944
MDPTADPCENFYQFSCGNFPEKHPVKEGLSTSSWFAEAEENLDKRFLELLQENSSRLDPEPVRQMKSFFKHCMDTGTLDKMGLKPVMEVLGEVSLPRQIPDSQTAEGWDVATTLAKLQKLLKLNSLVALNVDHSSDTTILQLRSPPETPEIFSIIGEHEASPKVISFMKIEKEELRDQLMTEILKHIDTWSDKQQHDEEIYKTVIKDVLEISGNVSEASENAPSSNNKVVITIPELQIIVDSSIRGAKTDRKVNWTTFLEELTAGINNTFDLNEHAVSIEHTNYFQNLAWLIANTDIVKIQRFVWWQVIEQLVPLTNRVMRDIQQQILTTISGEQVSKPRSTVCVNQVKTLFKEIAGYLMASRNDISSTVKKVSNMMNDIKRSFESLVRDSDWLDSDTMNAAIEKSEAIITYIGHQDWLLEPGYLERKYKPLNLKKNQYLWNVLQAKSLQVEELLKKVNKPNQKYRNYTWSEYHTLEVNARYSTKENVILIPAGILQFPFHHRGLDVLAYGAIGAILGHELTHGFDSNGKSYGKYGDQKSWWKETTLEKYQDKEECFVKQYSNISIDGIQVDGHRTLEENIADNGGIREAYWAYQRYKKREGPQPTLPGLEDFSDEQLLFLSYGNMMCLDKGKKYAEKVRIDVHSPEEARILGSLSNSPEFSMTWDCPSNSTMNPPDRCIIW